MSILVIGAYGTVGSRVAAGLRSAGIPIRGSSRKPETTESPGLEMVRLDLDEPETLPAALDGIDKVFLYSVPEHIAEFVGAAQAAGVEHVVLLSSCAVVEPVAQRTRAAQIHSAVEQAVRESGIAWTFLRPTTFATTRLHWAQAIRSGEELRIPFLRMETAAIHERDIADVAVRALTGDGHAGKGYWLTGPQAMTQREHAETIAAVTGRSVDVAEMSPEDVGNLPAPFVRTMTERMNAPCVVTSTVEEVTGTPARSFRQWVEDHIADFS
ncbi:NAD(P)H-binding protein [Nocardia bovistercoris]|uniref:NAD(P)H-binding protein n=1 Tax=Nocardia bovistercoris TaxID=2785916 RepID=A0A931N8K3_9NOCA|nr:NAD(P)H-binding protein [Nocardia bovistercoris]MBH0781868.1 NAD(P)H-binding protein [Nocardia bovistercoris]